MPITAKPKPASHSPSTPPTAERLAQEEALIRKGGAPAGYTETSAPGGEDAEPLLTPEELNKMEHLQLRPPAYLVRQMDRCRVAAAKHRKMESRVSWCESAVRRAIAEHVEQYGIVFGPNETAPPLAPRTHRRQRVPKASS